MDACGFIVEWKPILTYATFQLYNFRRLLLTGKYFVVGDNIRNISECVPPGIELGISGFIVDWKSILRLLMKRCIAWTAVFRSSSGMHSCRTPLADLTTEPCGTHERTRPSRCMSASPVVIASPDETGSHQLHGNPTHPRAIIMLDKYAAHTLLSGHNFGSS